MCKILGIFLIFVFASADAALISRTGAGGAAYYDDVLDITWLADANYAQTSGYDADGKMTWDESQTWIGTLNTANYLGVNNWRLPTVTDTGASGCDFAYAGTDCGWNVQTGTAATTVYSEMASLYYDTLGNLSWYDTSGSGPQAGNGLSNTGPFSNLRSREYWSGTEYAPNTSRAWFFGFDLGPQADGNKKENEFFGWDNELYAWAVGSGDIAAVPLPAAVWLFGSGLLGLLGMRRAAGCGWGSDQRKLLRT